MATATAAKTTRAREVYRNPTSLETTTIRYFLDRKTGVHVVVREFANDYPNVVRHDSIEAARETWRTLREHIKAAGFTVRIG